METLKILRQEIEDKTTDIWRFTDFKPLNDTSFGNGHSFKDILEARNIETLTSKAMPSPSEQNAENLPSLQTLVQNAVEREDLEQYVVLENGRVNTEISTIPATASATILADENKLVIENSKGHVYGIVLVQTSLAAVAEFSIQVPEGSSATVKVIECHGCSQPAFANNQLNWDVDKNAELSVLFTSLTRKASDVTRFLTTTFNLSEKSKLNALDMMQNQVFSRHKLTVNFKGEDAEANLNGIGLFTGNSRQHTHITVNHDVKNCHSTQLYKQLLFDTARAEFSGLVSVAEGASGTLSDQSNPNLLFSDDARAYSRPQLNILNDDVQCNHGSTIGQLDHMAVFYLKSRGINENEAKRVLLHGFIEEVVEDLFEEDISEGVAKQLSKTLDDVMRNRD